MTTVTGTVEAVSTREVKTKFGMKPTYAIRVEGEWYNNGFKKLPCDKGDDVELEYKETPYGKDITSLTGGSGGPSPRNGSAPSARPVANTFPIPAGSKENAIIRQNAMSQVLKSLEIRPEVVSSFETDASFWDYVKFTTDEVASFLAGREEEKGAED